MKLNQSVLTELNAWCQEIPRFTAKHAADGLLFGQNIIAELSQRGVAPAGGEGPYSDRAVFLLALDTAFCLWIDDCYDASPESGALIDIDALTRVADEPPATPEAEGFLRFRRRFREETDEDAAYRLWLDSALDMLRAYHENMHVPRSGRQWTYAEYMQNGESSIAVMHIVTTLSLISRFDMPARMRDARFLRIMRNLCRTMRLQNDLASVERERDDGVQSNAVIVMERALPAEAAWSFVLAEREGYERLLRRDLEGLPAGDPFTAVALTMIAITEKFYVINRDRYAKKA
jgi:Terpene synthase family 2, C-terminal metal binding